MQIRRSLAATMAALASVTVVPSDAAGQLGVQRERNTPTAYAITNARIVPVTGAPIARGTVVIRNGMIAAVGANVAAPADARVIDGNGLTVYPGFIDTHTSLGQPAGGGGGGGGRGGPPTAGPAAQQATPTGAPNSLHPIGLQPELTAISVLRADVDAFTAAHAAGITAALTAPSSGIFLGQSAVITLREGEAQEILLRSPVAMHVGFTPLRSGGYPGSLLGVFAALRQMLLDAQHYGQLHAAYAANPRGMSRPEIDPSLAALQPVLRREMPVVMAASTQREIERALDLAKEFNLRAVIAGGAEAYKVADRLKTENVPVLLAVNFPRRTGTPSPDADPEPLRVLRDRVEAPRSPSRLLQAGVRFAFQAGGSNGYGEYLNNVQRAVDAGLSRDAALRAMTLGAAELLGVADRLGTIETGKIANLTVVRGELFTPGARVAQLFVDGQPIEVRAAGGAGATQPAATTAAGQWTVTVTIEGTERAITLGLQQEGERLRGTMQGALGTGQVSNGSVGATGDLKFTATVTLPGGTEEATFTGQLTGNTMRGTVQIVGHPNGTFVGTRPSTGGPGRGGRGAPPPSAAARR